VRHERLAGARGPRLAAALQEVTPISASSAATDWDTADCVYERVGRRRNDPRLATSLKTRSRWGSALASLLTQSEESLVLLAGSGTIASNERPSQFRGKERK
jgi:hypothetical protein